MTLQHCLKQKKLWIQGLHLNKVRVMVPEFICFSFTVSCFWIFVFMGIGSCDHGKVMEYE